MLKVCFFAGDITRGGGAERVATEVAGGLCSKGNYRVLILSLTEQETEPFYPISREIRRFVLRNDGKWTLPGPGYLPFIPALRRFMRKQKIDIMIDVDMVLDVLSLPAAAGLPVKVVSWEHFHCYFEQSILYRKAISKLSVAFADYMVTLTERDRQNYVRKMHRKDRITAIANPVEIPPNISGEKEKMLITVGRLEYAKGIDMLAGIIPKVLEKAGDWRWYFLGDGECRGLLETVRRDHGLEERLVLTGRVKDVGSYLKRASIFVTASRSEGLPMCILEARAYQIPCIAFDVPVGIPELIRHGVNGFLVPPFDPEDMTGKILRLIEDEALRKRFSGAAAMGMEKYSLERILDRWTEALDTVSGYPIERLRKRKDRKRHGGD